MKFRFPFFRKRPGRCVILFVRYPEKGAVKTRLAKVLGEDKTLELYRNFVLDALDSFREINARRCVWYYPENSKKQIRRWLGSGYEYFPQKGDDLGDRMKNAFAKVFGDGCREAVLVGSDIPDLSPDIINEAFSGLGESDAVLGPAADGGYYLIGFRGESFLPAAFEGMRWSVPGVLASTRRVLEQAGESVATLPELSDIDTIYDLRKYFERARHSRGEESHTYRFLVG
jgi:rSAM/selenodomain-associated transferase 1